MASEDFNASCVGAAVAPALQVRAHTTVLRLSRCCVNQLPDEVGADRQSTRSLNNENTAMITLDLKPVSHMHVGPPIEELSGACCCCH